MRGLNEKSYVILRNNPAIQALIKQINSGNENEIFIAVRDNYLTLYYDGLRIMDIKFNAATGQIIGVECAPEYLTNFASTSLDEKNINIQDVIKIIEGIKNHSSKDVNKKERKLQHKIVLNNNKLKDTRWFCVDVEYQTTDYGRFDIIAVSTEKINGKYQIAIIELKVDSASMGAKTKDVEKWIASGEEKIKDINDWYLGRGSKIIGHFSNFQGFLNDHRSITFLKEDIVNSLISYKKIGLNDFKFLEICSKLEKIDIEKDFQELPRIVFLSCAVDDGIQTVIKTFKGTVFSHKYSILNLWDNKILEKWKQYYSCIFRDCNSNKEFQKEVFSDLEISEAKNIFDEEAYK